MFKLILDKTRLGVIMAIINFEKNMGKATVNSMGRKIV